MDTIYKLDTDKLNSNVFDKEPVDIPDAAQLVDLDNAFKSSQQFPAQIYCWQFHFYHFHLSLRFPLPRS